MNKQDRQGVRTAADLERKYKFGSIGEGGGGDSTQASKLSQLLSQFMTSTGQKFSAIEEKLKNIGKPSAEDVSYASSSLSATNVQDAIDELEEELEQKGDGGIYIGSGEMPEDCNVQIDPSGEIEEYVLKSEYDAKVAEIDSAISEQNKNIGSILKTESGQVNYEVAGYPAFQTITINFTKQFESIPDVRATVLSGKLQSTNSELNNDNLSYVSATVKSVTKTNCTIEIAQNYTSGIVIGVIGWIAESNSTVQSELNELNKNLILVNSKLIKYIVVNVEVSSSGEVNLGQYLGANKLPVFVVGSTGRITNGTGSYEYIPYIIGDPNVNTTKTIGVYYFEI